LTDVSAVLELNNLSKSYGKTQALKNVTFSIGRAEIVGLLGPNGAGKSTLFQIAAGLFAPDGGGVSVFGLDYRGQAAEILKRLGVVFQARAIDLDMTVRANLAFHGALFGLAGEPLKTRITEVTNLLEIADLLKKPVRALSGGNQRRVEVARALLNAPDLLLMDEPSTGLDPVTREMLVQHMQNVRREHGTSILWATHLVEELENADRIILLVAGEIVHAGSPAELMAASGTGNLTAAYIALTGHQPELAAAGA
jgi:ABC-2 type transport system ATP-binding protein